MFCEENVFINNLLYSKIIGIKDSRTYRKYNPGKADLLENHTKLTVGSYGQATAMSKTCPQTIATSCDEFAKNKPFPKNYGPLYYVTIVIRNVLICSPYYRYINSYTIVDILYCIVILKLLVFLIY